MSHFPYTLFNPSTCMWRMNSPEKMQWDHVVMNWTDGVNWPRWTFIKPIYYITQYLYLSVNMVKAILPSLLLDFRVRLTCVRSSVWDTGPCFLWDVSPSLCSTWPGLHRAAIQGQLSWSQHSCAKRGTMRGITPALPSCQLLLYWLFNECLFCFLSFLVPGCMLCFLCGQTVHYYYRSIVLLPRAWE